MKILTIIGARPQFIKAAALSAKIAEFKKHKLVNEVIVHTGQHYDREMSHVFFNELNIPREKYNLRCGSDTHASQTAKMLPELEKIIFKEKPDFVLLYGDTNSTLAGAIAAAKTSARIVHVEAGMRSFNRKMPEEINRIVADHLSHINFCSSKTAMRNLKNEGLAKTAKFVGDIMFDVLRLFSEKFAQNEEKILCDFRTEKKQYILMTCHRAENTDNIENLEAIILAANKISKKVKIIFPVHPRTKKILSKCRIKLSESIFQCQPLGYIQNIALLKNSLMLITDSGGMQKEAFFFKVPCITTRNETEWVETVQLGANILTGANTEKILSAFAKFANNPLKFPRISPYGDGHTSDKILRILLEKE